MLIINGKDNDDSADNEYGIGGVIMRTLSFPDIAGKKGLFVDGDWIEKKDQDAKGKVRLIQLADIGSGAFLDKSDRYITEDKACELHCTFLRKGDVLIARLGEPICKCCLFPFEGNYITAVDVAILRIGRDDINPKYLVYLINSPWFKNRAKEFESGTTRKRISRKNMEKILLPFPSLDEQARIVARIEELFSELDAGVDTLQKIKQQLSVYRQAVLKEAFDQCSEFVAFGTITESRLGKMLDQEKNIGTPHKYLRNINVRWFSFDLSDMLEMRIAEDELDKYSIQKGDLVICEGGEPGRCAVWQDDERIFYQKALHRVRFKDDSNPLFYMYYLWHAAQIGRLNPFFTGTGIKHLTGQSLVKVPVPNIGRLQQDKTVSEIETRLSLCDDIEKTVDQALQQSAAMRQSILKQAFEGGL